MLLMSDGDESDGGGVWCECEEEDELDAWECCIDMDDEGDDPSFDDEADGGARCALDMLMVPFAEMKAWVREV